MGLRTSLGGDLVPDTVVQGVEVRAVLRPGGLVLKALFAKFGLKEILSEIGRMGRSSVLLPNVRGHGMVLGHIGYPRQEGLVENPAVLAGFEAIYPDLNQIGGDTSPAEAIAPKSMTERCFENVWRMWHVLVVWGTSPSSAMAMYLEFRRLYFI